MKILISTALFLMLNSLSMASDIRFYLGTYTGDRSKGIYTGTLDAETGKLGPLTLAGELANPSFITLSKDGRFLYAVTENGEGRVSAFRVLPDATLELLNHQSCGGPGPCYLSLDAAGKNVLVANYSGGSVAVIQLQPDGSLGPRTDFVQFTGTGPNHSRQEKPHAHFIHSDETNRFVYATDLGTDNIWSFKFDASKGTLALNDPPSAKVPPGGGPRHLAFSADGKWVYASNEMGVSVTAFSRDTASGALTPIQTISALPEGASADGITSAAIFIHPNGHWLYIANRSPDSITSYTIGYDGKLTWIENFIVPAKIPRDFKIDPTGKWMIVAGQKENKIIVLKIDSKSGKLSLTDQTADVGAPTNVIFAPGK